MSRSYSSYEPLTSNYCSYEPLTNRRLCWQLYERKIDKIGSWFCANLLRPAGPNANVSIPLSSLTILLTGHPLDQVKIFKYLGVLLSHDMSNQSAVRIGRSLASSTDNFITIHQAIKFTCSTLSFPGYNPPLLCISHLDRNLLVTWLQDLGRVYI